MTDLGAYAADGARKLAVTMNGGSGSAFSSQPANRVFAGPSSGADAIPTFRLLVADDIPSLDAAKITSGTFATARIPDLDAAKITSGTFATARIPDLDAAKITTGTFNNARINWAAPGTIGSTTPNTAVFTSINGTGLDMLGEAIFRSTINLSIPNSVDIRYTDFAGRERIVFWFSSDELRVGDSTGAGTAFSTAIYTGGSVAITIPTTRSITFTPGATSDWTANSYRHVSYQGTGNLTLTSTGASASVSLVGSGSTATVSIAGGNSDTTGTINIGAGTVNIANNSANKIGFFGTTAVVRTSAYTQTYSSTTRTHNAYTTDAENVAYTGIDNAQAGTPYAQVSDVNALRTAYETLRAAHDNAKNLLNQVIDDLQAYGLFQ